VGLAAGERPAIRRIKTNPLVRPRKGSKELYHPLRVVAELLRDKTLAMVMRYAHLAPDYKLEAVERMAVAFSGSKADTKVAPTKNCPPARNELYTISFVFAYTYGRARVAEWQTLRT
jgi:hypothetical protein